MPRLHKDPETTDHSLETSSVPQPVPLLLDEIPRAKCGLVLSLPVRTLPLNLAGLTGSELSRTLKFPPHLGWEGNFDLNPKGLSSLDAIWEGLGLRQPGKTVATACQVSSHGMKQALL